MRVAVNAKVLSETQPNGIGIYTHNLLKAMAKLDKKNEYVLYSNEPIVQKVNGKNFSEKILKFPKLWSYLRFPFEFIDKKYDLLFVPKEVIPPVKRPRTVITCYGFGQHIVKGDKLDINSKVHNFLAFNYVLKAADRIIAISESVKNDIVENYGVYPEKVDVTYLGYEKDLYKPCGNSKLIEATKQKYGIKGKYIINTSSLLWFRKNLVTLINAYSLCRKRLGMEHKLVITGRRGEAFEELTKLISSLRLEGEVILTQYIPKADMPLLLSGADCMVFPSLHEGFGLSVLEAMACGCPVITSNCSSLPEVIGDAGELIDPYDTEQISKTIEKVLVDQKLQETMGNAGIKRAKIFSWENTARETLEIFEKVYRS